jgi:hypothetical protein
LLLSLADDRSVYAQNYLHEPYNRGLNPETVLQSYFFQSLDKLGSGYRHKSTQ